MYTATLLDLHIQSIMIGTMYVHSHSTRPVYSVYIGTMYAHSHSTSSCVHTAYVHNHCTRTVYVHNNSNVTVYVHIHSTGISGIMCFMRKKIELCTRTQPFYWTGLCTQPSVRTYKTFFWVHSTSCLVLITRLCPERFYIFAAYSLLPIEHKCCC